jgi:hypothetical protein
MVNYRGYLIHFRSEVLSWRFMAAPASPELPILSRGASPQFPSRDDALAEAKKQIDHLLGLERNRPAVDASWVSSADYRQMPIK